MTEQEFDRKVEELARRFERPAGGEPDAKVEREQAVSPDGEGRLGGDGNGAAAGCGVPAAKGFFDNGAVVCGHWNCGAGV